MRTLLIVDDIGTNREILKKILGGEYQILEAANGVEALSAMRRSYETLSAVLLDLSMPVMNGFEVLEQTRQSPELSHLPIIVTTGKTEEESEVRALALGANDYITKPYNSTIIKQRIRNTINLRETAATVNALQRDALTGLYNREIFFQKAGELIASRPSGAYTMSCFNVDSFKVINDQYGAEMGDRVLRHIADYLRQWAAPVGGLCCRVMADNFALLFPSELTHSEGIRENHRAVSSPPCLGRPINIRIGRYVVTDPSLTVSAIYDRATLAEASIKGRYDTYIAEYDESMRTRLLREQELINDMNGALAENQFEVWFQPQFNHSSGSIIGAEGLVRWRHPQKGLVPPGEFIPVFERNGFIYKLDQYVWEQACRCLRKWLDEGRAPLPVSVNISRHDLFREDLIEVITGLVRTYDLPVDMLKLEITESAFAQSTDHIIDVVEKLIEKGFTVEIDDFGSGYSSLNTLKDVPANVLKLDMRFLENGRNSARGGNIIESVIRMAKWLGMPVIAEGVETIEQADYLKSIGCYYIQGYLYARPMCASDYEAFVKNYRKETEMLRLETVETLDNNAFWNPESMETLIFNSYVGGACIFEYHNGKMELLRINENYVRELGAGALSASDAFALDLESCMDEENRATLHRNILYAIESGTESSCDIRLTGLGGGNERTYLRATVRMIARTGSRHLLYCAIFNMTALRESERKEREASEQVLTMMNDTPGGFCRMRLFPDGSVRLLYLNPGLCELLGMTRATAMAAYGPGEESSARLRSEKLVHAAFEQMRAGGDSFQIRYQLPRGDGESLWVLASGRITRTELDEVYLNAYFTDISREKRREDAQRELLDNLPCGAALYVLEGDSLRAAHLNRRYRELVGREIDDPTRASVVGAVHPDDRAPMMAELRAAIAQNRDVACDVRLRYGENGDAYRAFHIIGRVIPNAGGSYSIYATFSQP